jgi:hypothetical protein
MVGPTVPALHLFGHDSVAPARRLTWATERRNCYLSLVARTAADSWRGLYAAEESPNPTSGGGSCTAASQSTAADRIARSRATPTPTPVAIAQLSASAHEDRRSAATFGGVDPRSAFQATSRTRCVTSPVKAPTPAVTAFQPYFLTNDTLTTYPNGPLPNRAPVQMPTRRRAALHTTPRAPVRLRLWGVAFIGDTDTQSREDPQS